MCLDVVWLIQTKRNLGVRWNASGKGNPEDGTMTRGDAGPESQPGSEHMKLEPLVGIWKTRGSTIASASMPAVEFSGTDSYEWLQGGFFLLHRVDVLMGDRRVIGVETIWFDPARRCYRTHFVDVEGQTSTYEAQLDGREWTLASLADRFAGHFSEDWATISGRWERTVGDADWEPWMDVTLTRVS